MAIKSLNITEAINQVRTLIQSDQLLSQADKAAIEVLIEAVTLLSQRGTTNSKNSSILGCRNLFSNTLFNNLSSNI